MLRLPYLDRRNSGKIFEEADKNFVSKSRTKIKKKGLYFQSISDFPIFVPKSTYFLEKLQLFSVDAKIPDI